MMKKRYQGKWLPAILVTLMVLLVGSFSYAAESLSPDRSVAKTEHGLECFMVLAGKNATADGSVLAAHNNDLKGHEASMIKKVPRQKHEAGEVVKFTSGLEIPQVEETNEWMVLQIHSGFAEGDAIAVNEHQVCIAGGQALGKDRNEKARKADPLEKKGLTGGVRYMALSRSKTAKECVTLMGELYSKYGVTYPSGVGVVDPNEVWYLEPGGGHTWVAVRIPDDSYWVAGNGFRVGKIDPDDTENVILSPGLLDFAKKNGLWNPEDGPFNFRKAFGGGREEYTFDTRRVWSAMRHLSPSLSLDPNQREFPMFAVPDEKITVKKLTAVLRDRYDGTEFAVNPVEGIGTKERPISVPSCVHTNVVQLRSGMPSDIGAILWAGLGAAQTTTYVPYYFGISGAPKAFQTAGPIYDPDSAFWAFKTLAILVKPYHNQLIDMVLPVWQKMEEEAYQKQSSIEEVALVLYKEDQQLAKSFLATYSNGISLKALDTAKSLANNLITEIASQTDKLQTYNCAW
ncbi:MAG: C69 family dipeptidase [Planctomycetaceae bacterium]|nr:C69 family dipeptidase [Planctomycetaceae bacterium]